MNELQLGPEGLEIATVLAALASLAPEKLYSFGNLESVNLFNGNLSLTIPIGPTSRGAKRVLQVESDEAAKTVGKQLSTDGKVRKVEKSGQYPEHRNPSEGPYSDVHIESAAKTSLTIGGVVGGVVATIGAVVSPAQSAVIESGDPSPGELASAAAWDAVSAIDPTGISDLINWYVGVP